jgi:ribosome biogenesis GTPase
VVLVGSSGAGKSTLTNGLLGTQRMKTAQVRQSDDRGRHTTTHRALIPLPAGACLIDTPGMREVKPTGEEDVAETATSSTSPRNAGSATARTPEPGCAVNERSSRQGDPQRFANPEARGEAPAPPKLPAPRRPEGAGKAATRLDKRGREDAATETTDAAFASR